MSREQAAMPSRPSGERAREEVSTSTYPVCDACGRRHSDACSFIEYAGQRFNVCGECVPEVKENPADFLAGKKGTEPES
jgi:ribosome-binding protein aMBF1 (putative translation factor)